MSVSRHQRGADIGGSTHLLLVRLVDGVACILDGDATEVACSDFEAQRPVEVNPLHRWGGEQLLEDILVLNV